MLITVVTTLIGADNSSIAGLNWLSIITEVGVVACIALFLVWTTWRREQRLAERVTDLETQKDVLNDRLLSVIESNVAAQTENTNALRELTSWFKKRPCMAEGAVEKFVEEHALVIKRMAEMEQNRKKGSDG